MYIVRTERLLRLKQSKRMFRQIGVTIFGRLTIHIRDLLKSNSKQVFGAVVILATALLQKG